MHGDGAIVRPLFRIPVRADEVGVDVDNKEVSVSDSAVEYADESKLEVVSKEEAGVRDTWSCWGFEFLG